MLGDVMIPLATHPAGVTPEVVDRLLDLAATFATHATLRPLEITAPTLTPRWSGAFLGLTGLGSEIERASREASKALLARGTDREGLRVSGRPLRVGMSDFTPFSEAARYHDLTMISFSDPEAGSALAQAAMFGTGRPTLLVPANIAKPRSSFSRIAFAWDGSETASRALHDAMPLVVKADGVVVINAPADKAVQADRIADLTAYFERHGVTSEFVEADIEVMDIGLALQAAAARQGAELLVMGAFGHSRLQQFILGGATRGVLQHVQLPVLMSHS